MHHKLDQLIDIPAGPYDGYLWYSDKPIPKLLQGQKVDFSQVKAKPFIIEAWLYSEADHQSILIRHSGNYHIHQYDLNQLPEGGAWQSIGYRSHRMEPIKKLYFQQLWLPVPDPLCENISVMQAQALIFTGFKKK